MHDQADQDKNRFRSTASNQVLVLRAQTLKKIRQFFEARDFLEVDTPLLSRDTVIDRHIDPIELSLSLNDRERFGAESFYLQTSPEFGMKRLLACGLERIFQIAHAFRLGERGERHNPEFTMIEWYRVGDDLQSGIQLLGELACDLFGSQRYQELSYREAFRRHCDIDPFTSDCRELFQSARRLEVDIPVGGHEDRELICECLLTEVIEPQLGFEQPEIMYDYPASQAALAKVVERDGHQVAERFELYYRGVELANGYHELLDAKELRSRNQQNNALRVLDGKGPLPTESHLLAAMEHGLPACAGVALGFDRLIMLLSQSDKIDEVIPFPIERA